jgi:hypothetical protein
MSLKEKKLQPNGLYSVVKKWEIQSTKTALIYKTIFNKLYQTCFFSYLLDKLKYNSHRKSFKEHNHEEKLSFTGTIDRLHERSVRLFLPEWGLAKNSIYVYTYTCIYVLIRSLKLRMSLIYYRHLVISILDWKINANKIIFRTRMER